MKAEGGSGGEGMAECLPTMSHTSGKRKLCSGETIFSDHFTEERIDLAKWRKHIYFSVFLLNKLKQLLNVFIFF
jgi:hypothetical protein